MVIIKNMERSQINNLTSYLKKVGVKKERAKSAQMKQKEVIKSRN